MVKLFCLTLFTLASSLLAAQSNNASAQSQGSNGQQDNTPAARLAHHIADKMKDTLGLSNQQRANVFKINMDLFKAKKEARGQSQPRDSVGRKLQAIEATRDSHYKEVLTQGQYVLYLQKKRWLVTSQ